MKTNLTEFQRSFRAARAAADRGESVIIEGEGRKYVFETISDQGNPFEGLEHVFGSVTLGRKKGTHREQARADQKEASSLIRAFWWPPSRPTNRIMRGRGECSRG